MKSSHIHLSLLSAAALFLTMAPRQAAARADDAAIQVHGVVVRGDAPGAAKKQSHTVEIRTDDDKVSVRLDGKEIPANRLRFEGGRVIVLDEKGNEMKDLGLFISKPGDKGHAEELKAELEAMEQARPPVMLGIQMSDPDEALRRHLHLEPNQASIVIALYEGLPAQKGGIDQYDVIIAVNGKRPAGPGEVREALAGKAAGDELKLTVIHDGQTVERTVKLEAWDAERMKSAQVIGEVSAFAPEMGAAPGHPFEWRKLLVDPHSQQWFRWLHESGLSDQLREQLRDQWPQDLDSRLERLNQRIDEIKEVIDELIQQARELARESKEPKKEPRGQERGPG